MAKELIQLTEEQKQKIKDLWNSRVEKNEPPPTLTECVQVNFPNEDGRSLYGISTKRVLSEFNFKAKPSSQYEPKKRVSKIELTDNQKEFIKNNVGTTKMNCLEAAKIIFNNNQLSNLSREYRMVVIFSKENGLIQEHEVELLEEYVPPRNFIETLARINKYIPRKLEETNMSPQQRKEVEHTLALLRDVRFIHHINAFEVQIERDLFESSFIKGIYNKSDLSAEEVDLFQNLSLDVVSLAQAIKRKNRLITLFQNAAEASDGARASQSIGEQIDSITKEINDIKSRMQKLVGDLTGRRKERINLKIAQNQSIVALVEAWKTKLHREKMVKYAIGRDDEIRKILKEQEDMSSIKSSIFGIHSEEVVPEEDKQEVKEILDEADKKEDNE